MDKPLPAPCLTLPCVLPCRCSLFPCFCPLASVLLLQGCCYAAVVLATITLASLCCPPSPSGLNNQADSSTAHFSTLASWMNLTFKDAKILCSSLWHEEELTYKKRRWLMQLPSQDTNQAGPKKLKKPKSLLNRFLAESFVRKDEVSPHAVKINIESYRSLRFPDERLKDVQNYIALSDVLLLQGCFLEQSSLKKFHSTLDCLSNNALDILAYLVTKNNVNFERTRLGMKKVIKDHFTDNLSDSNDSELVPTLQLLSEILMNPEDFYEKQLSLPAFDCSSTLKSIYMALDLLENMPNFALSALNRKLIGLKMVPRFPPSKSGYNKKMLINKIRKRFEDLILVLNKENFMPVELGKALSLVHLYFKHKTKCSDTLISKYISSSKENVKLQNAILEALWSLPTATSYQLKYLQSNMGLKLECGSTGFLSDLKQYLMLCLFACDEIDLPSDVSDVLGILNNSSSSQTQICSNETIEEETEAVLNVSAELNKFVLRLKSYTSTDGMAAEGLESDDDTVGNDFQLVDSDFFLNPVKCQQQENDELEEITGDSMPGTYFATSDSCRENLPSKVPNGIKHGCVKNLKEEQVDIHELKHIFKDHKDFSIEEICDETSLVSYRLIDHMLDSFLLEEGRNLNVVAKRRLRGQASCSEADQKDILNASEDNVGIKVLMQTIGDILPSIPKSCSQGMKKLMKKP